MKLKILKYLFISSVFVSAIGSAIAAVVLMYFSAGLPRIIGIEDYKPAIVSTVLGKNDVIVGEFFEEKRYVLAPDKIPEMVYQAFVSAEDDRFFEHQGIDLMGIVRAAVANMRAGKVVQGGSTITQQVAKSLLLTPERSYVRKIREIILSFQMERNLTKKQILYLYLNQIYLGQGAYGIEAASRTYFNKTASEISVAEAAILAGLPQAPSKYSPLLNPKRAKERQAYVLRRMFEDGAINKSQMESAVAEEIKIYYTKDINFEIAPYYVEFIRKQVYEKYGKDKIYREGLVIKSPVDALLSKQAMTSIQEGLRGVDKKQGYRGPLESVKGEREIDEALIKVEEYNVGLTHPFDILTEKGDLTKESIHRLKSSELALDVFKTQLLYKALVTSTDDFRKELNIRLTRDLKAVIPLDKMNWAEPVKVPSSEGITLLVKPSQSQIKRGDIILVKLIDKYPKTGVPIAALEQEPLVQGALLSMDTYTGEVLSMVGGYKYEQSEFNRAVQALRQPGSAFKPIIYSAALDKGYTPATIIQDSPIVFDSGVFGKWKPENFEEKFYGDTTFRSALIKSRNIPTIKIVMDIQIPYLVDYAKRLGFNAGINPDLSISLGTFGISLFDLAKVYAIFPRGGRRLEPIFITSITDREGKVIEEHNPTPVAPPINLTLPHPPPAVKVCGELHAEIASGVESHRGEFTPDPTDPDRIIDPRTAYVMTHLMNEVATIGTGAEAKNLGRQAAGKTGTTNDYVDAWFMGFTPQMVTGVWAGFDAQRTIAPKATGGLVALPIWLDYMKEAVKAYPAQEFQTPKGVKVVSIDGATGRLISSKATGAVQEAFVEGTEPGAEQYLGENPGTKGSAGNSTGISGVQNGKPTLVVPQPTNDSADGFYKDDIQ